MKVKVNTDSSPINCNPNVNFVVVRIVSTFFPIVDILKVQVAGIVHRTVW